MTDEPTIATGEGVAQVAVGDVFSQPDAEAFVQQLKSLQKASKESEKVADEIDNRIRGMRAEEETEVRKFVTKTVISGYGIVIIGSILVVVLISIFGTGWPKELSDWIHDLLLAMVLPIVTLVLGYYFGSSSK